MQYYLTKHTLHKMESASDIIEVPLYIHWSKDQTVQTQTQIYIIQVYLYPIVLGHLASYPGRVGGLVSTVCACATFTRISGNPDSIAFYPCLSLGMRLR